jgi:YVTN family beta-propeller protein
MVTRSSVARREVYVTNEFDDTLSVIDPAAVRVAATIKVGMMPHFAMVVGDRLFVTDFGGRAAFLWNQTL